MMNSKLIFKFSDETDLLQAVDILIQNQKFHFQTISPYPVKINDKNEKQYRKISFWVLLGSLISLVTGTVFFWWNSNYYYRLNFGGRSFFNFQLFLPILFEISILFALLFGIVAFLKKAGLPFWREANEDLTGEFALIISESEIQDNLIDEILEFSELIKQ